MSEMRTWFDRHGISAAAFDHSSSGPGITFRVGFAQENDALAFAQAFGGSFNGNGEPDGAAR